MHAARWHFREVWAIAVVALGLAAHGTLAGAGAKRDPQPLVFENRYVVAPKAAPAVDSETEKQVAAAVQPRSVSSIDDLLARAAEESGIRIEPEVHEPEAQEPAEATETVVEPLAEAATTKSEPQSPPTAESVAQLEPVAEPEHVAELPVAESEHDAKLGVLPPAVSELPSIQPTTPVMEWDVGPVDVAGPPIEPPSEPWSPPVAEASDEIAPVDGYIPSADPTFPAADTTPLPAQPDRESVPDRQMVEELDAVWSEGFETAPPFAPAPSETDGAYHAVPYSPTTAELSRQLLPTVRRAYGLAQHGAVYAAQTEFIQVLRRIAEAKDAAEGVDTHSQSLAAGLRALDEADDFVPHGAQLEADMDVAVVISAHRTPVLLDKDAITRPAEMIALYHQYARGQLAQAVAGEQAGSMSLYGLGKIQNRLAFEADGELRHERKALTMFLAALDAGPGNHLAANEIGVLLSRGGLSAEASAMFRWAIDVAPTSTSYHNLAVVERTMGYHEQAAANEQYAWHLAQRDRAAGAVSRAKGVQWVAPQELSRVAQPLPIEADQNRMTGAPQRLPQPPDAGPVETAAKWPQKLVPGIFRR